MKTTITPVFLKNKYRTGKATAYYPACNEPDTKFKEEGVYRADVMLPPEKMGPIFKAYEEATKHWGELQVPAQAKTKLAAGTQKTSLEPWLELEDGNYRVNLRRPAVSRKGVQQKVKIIGKTLRPLTGDAALFGHGSVVDVGFSVKVWYTAQLGFGVSFMPDIVQVQQAEFLGGGGAETYGFEASEDADEDDSHGFEEVSDGDDGDDGDDEEF